jgi:hypothetical protein
MSSIGLSSDIGKNEKIALANIINITRDKNRSITFVKIRKML